MERLLKQIRKINKHDPFQGNVDIEYPADGADDMTQMKVTLRVPREEYFKTDPWGDAYCDSDEVDAYLFHITFDDEEYLDKPPKIRCQNDDIRHPNIEPGGGVCMNLLETYEWDDEMTLQGLISALFALLQSPNWDDPLHSISRSTSDDESSSY